MRHCSILVSGRKNAAISVWAPQLVPLTHWIFLGGGGQHFGTSTVKMKPHLEVGVTPNLRRRKKKKEKLQIDESNSDVSDVLCCVMKMPHSRATGALTLPLASARALLHQGTAVRL